jgi:hypothetical protein
MFSKSLNPAVATTAVLALKIAGLNSKIGHLPHSPNPLKQLG